MILPVSEVFSRSIGLSTLLVGRLGTQTMGSLYSVITRNEQGSAQFQRISV